MNIDEHDKMGPACKTCGHPAGAHSLAAGEDLDESGNAEACRYEGCECRVFAAEE